MDILLLLLLRFCLLEEVGLYYLTDDHSNGARVHILAAMRRMNRNRYVLVCPYLRMPLGSAPNKAESFKRGVCHALCT